MLFAHLFYYSVFKLHFFSLVSVRSTPVDNHSLIYHSAFLCSAQGEALLFSNYHNSYHARAFRYEPIYPSTIEAVGEVF